MTQEKLESAKNLFFIALGIDIAVTVIVVMSYIWDAGVLKDIGTGRIVADQSMISTFEFWDSFSKLMFLTILGVGLALVKWLNTCYTYAKETIGASGFKNERWTAGGWIIPIFNLFKPYQVINEIYKAGRSTYAGPDGWKKESASGLLLTWWIFWAVTHIIGWIVGKQMFKSAMRDDMTLQQSIGAIEIHAWFCVVSLIISGLWFLVAGNLTRRLLDRQCVGIAPILHGQPITVGLPMPSQNPEPSQPVTLSQAKTQLSPGQPTKTIRQTTANTTQFANPTQSLKFLPQSESTEEDFWATAMNEVETGQRRPGVWAKAFAECDGDETKAKVAYLKARVQQLTYAERAQQEERERQRAERERSALMEQERLKVQAEQQTLVDQAVTKFESGKPPTIEELAFLTDAAKKIPSIAKISDRLHKNTLLHWCARLQLDRLASTLVRLDADASALNDENQQAHQLARGVALKSMLAMAADRPKGTCPNCSTLILLTSPGCPKCGAVFGDGMAFNLVPVK